MELAIDDELREDDATNHKQKLANLGERLANNTKEEPGNIDLLKEGGVP
jgi:hypothetical protein